VTSSARLWTTLAAATVAVLLLVLAAVPVGADVSPLSKAPEGIVKYYIVRADAQGMPDTLAAIGERLLSSGSRSAEIFDLNRGRIQADGGRLTDPAVLHVGWALVLPWDAEGQGVMVGTLPQGPPAPTRDTTTSAAPERRTPSANRSGLTPTLAGTCRVTADDEGEPVPWAPLRLGLDQAWAVSRGEGTTLAVLTQGIDATAPALAGRVRPGVDVGSGQAPAIVDCPTSGTAVAGIIAASPQPGRALVGVAPAATILPITLSSDRPVIAAQFAAAVTAAVAAGVAVMVVPGMVDLTDPAVNAALDDAVGHDVLVVLAGTRPGASRAKARPGVLRVGAVAADDRMIERYATGGVDVLAPGDRVASLTADGRGRIEGSGTDLAVAFVAGVAALVRAAFPEITAAAAASQIERAAEGGREAAPDPVRGWGIINPARSVSAQFEPVSPAGGDDSSGSSGAGRAALLIGGAVLVLLVGAWLFWCSGGRQVGRVPESDRRGTRPA
jgi:membrane-anchored mycosin MYCP